MLVRSSSAGKAPLIAYRANCSASLKGGLVMRDRRRPAVLGRQVIRDPAAREAVVADILGDDIKACRLQRTHDAAAVGRGFEHTLGDRWLEIEQREHSLDRGEIRIKTPRILWVAALKSQRSDPNIVARSLPRPTASTPRRSLAIRRAPRGSV